MLITEQNKELLLEQGISKIPGGKTFLSLASKLGVTPNHEAFIDFTLDMTKAGLKFFKDKLVSLSQALAGTLATISSTAYAYYGYKEALSKDIEILLQEISKDPEAFKNQLIKTTNTYGNTDMLFNNLVIQKSPYNQAANEIMNELVNGLEKNIAQIKIKRILKSIKDPTLKGEFKSFFSIKNTSGINDLHKRFILNNLELRTKFHKDDGHPFIWLVVVKAKVIPVSVQGKSKTSSTKWLNPNAIKAVGLDPVWLKSGVKAEALQAIASAISTNNKLRAQAKTILKDYSKDLIDGDESEVAKTLAALEHNIESGLIFFGNEELVKEVVVELLVRNARDDKRKNIVKRTLQALPKHSILRSALTKDIESVPDDRPQEKPKEKPKPYTADEIGAARFIGQMIGYDANGAVWKALLNKYLSEKKLSSRPFIRSGPKVSEALKIKRLFNKIEPYNTLNLDSDNDIYIKGYIKHISDSWHDITTDVDDLGAPINITLDGLVRKFSKYTEDWFDKNPPKKEVSEIRVVNETLIFETQENEYLIPCDKFFKIRNVSENKSINALLEFKNDKIFNVSLDKVVGNIHLLSQDWEYIAKYLH